MAPTPASGEVSGDTKDSLPLILAVVGSVIAVVGLFMPRVESDTFIQVQGNTLIQNGDGIFIILLAAAAAGAAYSSRRQPGRNVAVLIFGLMIIGFAAYAGTGDRLELESVGRFARNGLTDQGTPGAGIWAVGVGGVVIALAGLLERSSGRSQGEVRPAPPKRFDAPGT